MHNYIKDQYEALKEQQMSAGMSAAVII